MSPRLDAHALLIVGTTLVSTVWVIGEVAWLASVGRACRSAVSRSCAVGLVMLLGSLVLSVPYSMLLEKAWPG